MSFPAFTANRQTAPLSLSPTLARISLPALAHNLAELRRILPSRTAIMAVVKADGYGHGSMTMAEALSQLGIQHFGVATVEEGVILREAGLSGTILVMGGLFPWQCKALINANLIPTLSDADIAHALSQQMSRKARPYSVHIKLDTGMRRLGFKPEEALPLLQSPIFSHDLSCRGLMTQLADAENPDAAFTRTQLEQFAQAVPHFRPDGAPIPCLHAANTAGILWHPQSWLDMVRPGLLLYGYAPTPGRHMPLSLQPVMTLTTQVAHVKTVGKGEPVSYGNLYRTKRDSLLAILPIGYTHGYNRRLSNKGEVIIRNQRLPIIGRVCMDMTVVDVTDAPGVKPGDEVLLLGKSETQEITAYDLAKWQDSIPYEVLCNLGSHVNRVYDPLPDKLQ